MKSLFRWIRNRILNRPDLIVGPEKDPYMIRWFVIPRNRFCNVYLHNFLKDDDDRALHDHPWSFVSIILKGGYIERTEAGLNPRFAGSIAFRRAKHRHQVELFDDHQTQSKKPCWTVIITGPKRRTWGFLVPRAIRSLV